MYSRENELGSSERCVTYQTGVRFPPAPPKTHQRKLVCFYFINEEAPYHVVPGVARRIRSGSLSEESSITVLSDVDAEMSVVLDLIRREECVEFRCGFGV